MYEKRISAIKLADAINAIEGVPVRKYAVDLTFLWAQGKISTEQMEEALLMSHRQIAESLKNG